MEGQQGGAVEPQLCQLLPLSLAQVVGQRQRCLLGVVAVKDRGALEASGAGKGAPLDAHGEEHRIQCHQRGHIRRKKAHGDGRSRRDARRQPPHIHMEHVGDDDGEHDAHHVDHQTQQMQQHTAPPAKECVADQLQQVHGLGTAQYPAAAQQGVTAEKAAYCSKGQMAAMIDRKKLLFRHGITPINNDKIILR